MYNKNKQYGKTESISSPSHSEENEIHCLLEEASNVARGVLESIQAIAGTTVVKGVQISNLERFARDRGYWIEDINTIGIFSDRGSENEVYLSIENNTTVYKLNDFRYSDDNLSQFFERIRIHNIYFPDCSYKLIGFAYNKAEKVCAVLLQPFIVAMREATEPEIEEELNKMGFSSELDGEFFSNGNYDIFDALPNNVLVGMTGIFILSIQSFIKVRIMALKNIKAYLPDIINKLILLKQNYYGNEILPKLRNATNIR